MTRRRLALVLAVLVVLVLALYIAARVYLASDRARGDVAARLAASYGGRVEVETADVGLTTDSAFRGIKLFEAGDHPEPWAEVAEVKADVSALSLLRGAEPGRVTLVRPAVTLRFAADGKLLTQLPTPASPTGALPLVRLEDGRLTLRQEGRPDFVLEGVTADLKSEDGLLTISGDVKDREWGDLSVGGDVDLKDSTFTLVLKSPRAAVTMAKLHRIPFVPPRVWAEVQAEGTAAVEFTFRHVAAPAPDRYRVVVEPDGATVDVRSVALHAEKVRGRVVEDDVVTLENVTGQTLGGTLTVNSSTMDFRPVEDHFTFDLVATGLDIQAIPKAWDLPELVRKVTGRLAGRAKLEVRIAGEVTTRGEGEGTITDVHLGKLAADPIRLKLRSLGRGFRFLSGDEPKPPEPEEPEEEPDDLPAPAVAQAIFRLTKWAFDGVRTEVIRVGRDLVARVPGGRPDPDRKPLLLDVNLGMKDVDLAELLEGIGYKPPFAVTGRVTFRVKATVPVDAPRDLTLYRLDGTATLAPLVLAGTRFDRLEGQVFYADGVLRLHSLKGTVAGGTFAGSARLDVEPPGDLTANLTLTDLPVGPLFDGVQGTVTGSAEVRAPSVGLNDLRTWRGSGRIASPALTVRGVTLREASAVVRLGGGRLAVSDLVGDLDGSTVTGDGELSLEPPYRGVARVRLGDLDLAQALKLAPEVALPVALRGTANLVVRLEGSLRGGPVEMTVEGTARRLRAGGLRGERVTGTVSYRDGSASYQVRGEAYGGAFSLDGRYPPTTTATAETRVRLDRVLLERIWEPLGLQGQLGPLDGRLDLQLELEQVTPDAMPTGLGFVSINSVRWGDVELAPRIRGDLRLDDGRLRLRDLSGTLGEGVMRGQLSFNLRQPERSWFTLALDRVEARRLLAPWPFLSDNVQGPTDVRLRGTLGREWRGSGDVILSRGKLFGVEVSEWRAPLSFSYAPREGRGQVDVPETSAQLGRGRATGRVSLGIGSATRLDGQVRFHGVDLATVLRQGFDLNQSASGQATGRIDFKGDDVRSLDDVTANVDVSFQQTQAMLLPVLGALAPYILPGQNSATFRSGELRGRLSGGVFRVQKLALSGGAVNLYGDGTVTTQGRLNLTLTATTGRTAVNTGLLRLIGFRLPAVGPIPVGLIVEVTEFFANRAMSLRLSGTTRTPIVHVDVLPLLTEEAVRFFLNRYGALP